MGLTALWVAIGALLLAGGFFVVVRLRTGGAFDRMRLAGVGTLTRVTQLVIGLSLIGAGYHVLAYALGLMSHFRAPLGLAIGVAIVATLGSIGIDALEHRQDAALDGDDDGPDEEKTPRSEE